MARPNTGSSKTPHEPGIASNRTVRFGLASRLTLRVGLVAAAAIGLVGWVARGAAAGELEHELNRQGIFAARIAATVPFDGWKGAAMERMLGTTGALDVWIVRAPNVTVASASGGTDFKYTDSEVLRQDDDKLTEIKRGRYGRGQAKPEEPARFFSHAIRDHNGKPIGHATVVYSERGIEAALSSMGARILTSCLMGLFATVGVLFAATRWVMRPLANLLKDVQTVAGGNFTHRTLVRSEDEIGVLADSFDRMTRDIAQTASLRAEISSHEQEAALVQDLQERLRPSRIAAIAGLGFDTASRSHGAISSDLYDQFVLPSGKVAVLLMTASERGLPAATVLSMARTAFRMAARSAESPAAILRLLNTQIAPDLKRGMFVGAMLAIIDPVDGGVCFASAGHRVPALHWIAAEGGLAKRQTSGIALGFDAGPVFDRALEESRFSLAPGDALVLISEGAFDAIPREQTAEGERKVLLGVLASARAGHKADALVMSIMKQVAERKGAADVSALLVTREAA